MTAAGMYHVNIIDIREKGVDHTAYVSRPRELSESLRGDVVGQTLLLKLGGVQRKVIVEDRQLVVFGPVLIEEYLRQERHVLGVPHIARIAEAE